uniref:Secreted protein n=1 Tax=Ascaris lumbricoides TaxID=6252 RepID=A0A0M3I1R2_ASCLU
MTTAYVSVRLWSVLRSSSFCRGDGLGMMSYSNVARDRINGIPNCSKNVCSLEMVRLIFSWTHILMSKEQLMTCIRRK